MRPPAYVLAAKRSGGKSGVMLMGGGSPKNFMLQTEPQIQEVLRIKEFGQDYFLQVTDARPDTGGPQRRHAAAKPSAGAKWIPTVCPMPWSATPIPPSPCRVLTHYALWLRHKAPEITAACMTSARTS